MVRPQGCDDSWSDGGHGEAARGWKCRLFQYRRTGEEVQSVSPAFAHSLRGCAACAKMSLGDGIPSGGRQWGRRGCREQRR